MGMKTLAVDKFLEWAFGQEFGHRAETGRAGDLASSWRAISDYGVLGTVVDVTSSPWTDFSLDAEAVHPDAKLAARVLREVAAAFNGRFWAGFDPTGDWAMEAGHAAPVLDALGQMRERAAAHRWPRHVAGLALAHAVLGRAPCDDCPMPPLRFAANANGSTRWFVTETRTDPATGRTVTFEVDGWCPRARRPKKGAWRRVEFAVSPVPGMLARLDHAVWRAALATMARVLAPHLVAHRLDPVSVPRPAWLARAWPAAKTASAAQSEISA